MTGNPALTEAISAEIAIAGGRITFARFMELALYHPQHGYYMSCRPPLRGGDNPCADNPNADSQSRPTIRPRIGRQGDFFTSVSVGPLLGRILARQFRAWGVTEVIEVGGHRGQLRQDVLAAAPELDYRVVEVGEDLPERITGCVVSNELLDALPVHRVVGDREVYVGQASSLSPSSNRQDACSTPFSETLGPLSDPRLPRLPDGYRSEFNLRALDWLTNVGHRLTESAYILTIDYGFERPEYFAPHHKDGHLQCYYRHTKSGNPYQHIGEQDITAHVEFTSLMEHPALETVLFTTQERYLMKLGADELIAQPNAARQLLHSTMGHAFKVLVQRKDQRYAASETP